MKEYTKKPKNQFTLNSNPRASEQATLSDIIQTYSNVTPGRQHKKRESVENKELQQSTISVNMPAQRIRIRLDDGADNIMLNVQASPVPQPGTIMVDGFRNYDTSHQDIGIDENIILEGHGTHLNPNHKNGDDYDSQAYLEPRKLANVAFLVPKRADWRGQIILFGCNTGPLSREVSRYYLALSKKPVNVIGTLADIRMEVRDLKHPNGHLRPAHTAKYEKDKNDEFPTAPDSSISARKGVRIWLQQCKMIFGDIAIKFYSLKEELNSDDIYRHNLINVADVIYCINSTLTMPLNYQGLRYDGVDDSLVHINLIQQMAKTAISELPSFEAMLNQADMNLKGLLEEVSRYTIFLQQLHIELETLERIIDLAEKSYPPGTVDWEGDSVLNYMAKDTQGLDKIEQLNRADIYSNKWGAGGMLVLEQMTT